MDSSSRRSSRNSSPANSSNSHSHSHSQPAAAVDSNQLATFTLLSALLANSGAGSGAGAGGAAGAGGGLGALASNPLLLGLLAAQQQQQPQQAHQRLAPSALPYHSGGGRDDRYSSSAYSGSGYTSSRDHRDSRGDSSRSRPNPNPNRSRSPERGSSSSSSYYRGGGDGRLRDTSDRYSSSRGASGVQTSSGRSSGGGKYSDDYYSLHNSHQLLCL